jgi:CheY-like chemotaxis protein
MALTSSEGVRVLVTGRKLLLADDSATIQKVVDLTFTDEGLEVITVGDGQQAIEKLEEIAPDIVLADVFMPGLSGYQVCEYIKRNERFRHIPVMLLVGSFEPFDEAEARRVGADDYLTKPFQSIRTLIGKVGNLLSGGGAADVDEATTRKLAPPPEAEKENIPDEEFIKRSTADTAPLPQHEREEMTKRSGSLRENPLADLSMDDQMIEATPANDYSNSGQSERVVQTQQLSRPTAAYSAADLREAGIAQALESATASEQQEEPVSAYAPAQVGEQSHTAAAGQSHVSSRAASSSIAASDDALLDLGDIEPPQAQAEADDFFLDLLDESPEQARSSAPSVASIFNPPGEPAAASSTAEEMDASARVSYEATTAEAPAQAREFAETEELGDEPRAEFEPVQEQTWPPVEYKDAEAASPSARGEFSTDLQSAPTERLPDPFQVEAAPAETGDAQGSAAASQSQATGQITLEQLSPEVIEVIARRAVEQLSARVVEQIAWEVVPQLAELLIKRRLEEEKQ